MRVTNYKLVPVEQVYPCAILVGDQMKVPLYGRQGRFMVHTIEYGGRKAGKLDEYNRDFVSFVYNLNGNHYLLLVLETIFSLIDAYLNALKSIIEYDPNTKADASLADAFSTLWGKSGSPRCGTKCPGTLCPSIIQR
jgi:hypothetical protein